MPQPALNSAFNELYPAGRHWYWTADFVDSLTDASVAEHVRFGADIPTVLSTMHLYPIKRRGAQGGTRGDRVRPPGGDLGRGHSRSRPDPVTFEAAKDWSVRYWEATDPHAKDGGYVNFMMEEGEDRIRATDGPNFERLTEIKATYDPQNLFRVNQNIPPRRDS